MNALAGKNTARGDAEVEPVGLPVRQTGKNDRWAAAITWL